MTQTKFNKGDRIFDGDSVFEIIDLYFDFNLNYKVRWVCGETSARKICAIPVVNNFRLTKWDDSIHYSPNKFKPFQKVLIRLEDGDFWEADLFGTYKPLCDNPYHCVGGWWKQCIPYEGNEHLLGKQDNCDKYYITWEEQV